MDKFTQEELLKQYCFSNGLKIHNIYSDIASGIDFEKRTNLFEYIYENVQTFITTTDLSNLNEELVKKAKIFKVENGNVVVSGEVK